MVYLAHLIGQKCGQNCDDSQIMYPMHDEIEFYCCHLQEYPKDIEQ